ncbi:hypothetical protein O3P69_017891 [Scylla paramamosain]|uniref:Uncharacterized protein n=1 Tax=Scylla paramamosain TaxID=85552 RepID=A0AAW0TG95_SCYPA
MTSAAITVRSLDPEYKKCQQRRHMQAIIAVQEDMDNIIYTSVAPPLLFGGGVPREPCSGAHYRRGPRVAGKVVAAALIKPRNVSVGNVKVRRRRFSLPDWRSLGTSGGRKQGTR